MMWVRRVATVTVLSGVAWTAWNQLGASTASACGGFFRPRASSEERAPSLAYEQTLIVFDEKKQLEHFVREVTFRAGAETFGFVVPTPSRPTVAKVDKSPFSGLRASFPYKRLEFGDRGVRGSGSGAGFGAGGGVRVLEVQKVGSFTAFVIAADDEKALAKWLAKQKLVSTPEADRWLAHYVKQRFYYAALRYDPPAGKRSIPRVKAETMRISFQSPLPYYPYFEPDPRPGSDTKEPRMLEVWLAATHASVPVALHSSAGKPRWVRPFAEGLRYDNANRSSLESALDKDKTLLPAGELVVQRFMDQKRSRVGFGDVVFVPATAGDSSAPKDALARLVPVLDPSLAAAAKAEEPKP